MDNDIKFNSEELTNAAHRLDLALESVSLDKISDDIINCEILLRKFPLNRGGLKICSEKNEDLIIFYELYIGTQGRKEVKRLFLKKYYIKEGGEQIVLINKCLIETKVEEKIKCHKYLPMFIDDYCDFIKSLTKIDKPA